MPYELDTRSAAFESDFAELLAAKRESQADVARDVAAIIDAVRRDGDAALCAYTKEFDHVALSPGDLRVDPAELAAASQSCDADAIAALRVAAERITDFHKRQKPEDLSYRDPVGVRLGHRWTAVSAAGLYVPGGTAAYPSSVLMNALPARVAGVERLVMVVPMPRGESNALVLAAAHLAGVDEVYRVGGAQAVAALAYGTDTIAPVDTIVGPGNAYVAAAKRQVFGVVGIDMIAGPSEVLVVADADNDPAWIASDLLAQAEHDTAAQSILITDSASFADAVGREVETQLKSLSRHNIAAASWQSHGAIILVPSLTEAPALVDRIAPEHLELAVADPAPLVDAIRNAGAIFLGRTTPEVLGDYVAGPNHVLPTARSARFSSGLSVLDFMKRSSIIECGPEGLEALGPAAVALARAEGLDGHARSVEIRLDTLTGKGEGALSE